MKYNSEILRILPILCLLFLFIFNVIYAISDFTWKNTKRNIWYYHIKRYKYDSNYGPSTYDTYHLESFLPRIIISKIYSDFTRYVRRPVDGFPDFLLYFSPPYFYIYYSFYMSFGILLLISRYRYIDTELVEPWAWRLLTTEISFVWNKKLDWNLRW